MTTTTNKSMKHLLYDVEEEVGLDIIDVRNATWDKTSLREDMRYLNTNRVMRDICRRIEEAFRSHSRYYGRQSEVDMIRATEQLLESYREIGAIQDFEVSTTEQVGASGEVETRVEASITPTLSLERVNIEINLQP